MSDRNVTVSLLPGPAGPWAAALVLLALIFLVWKGVEGYFELEQAKVMTEALRFSVLQGGTSS